MLVATPGQAGADPAWYGNLLVHPAVVLQVRTEVFAALARPASAAERPRLWELMVSVFPKYERYRKRAGRDLGVVIVTPSE